MVRLRSPTRVKSKKNTAIKSFNKNNNQNFQQRLYLLRRLLFLAVFISGQLIFLSGQQNNTLYLLHEVVQSGQLNPAVQPGCKLYVGIPGLNTLQVDYSNSALAYNDIVRGDSMILDNAYNRLGRNNLISAELFLSPVAVGYRYENHYFSFSIQERAYTHNSFSRNLPGLLLDGNFEDRGSVMRIRNTRLNAAWFRSYSAGWSMQYDPYTAFGIRANLMFGKVNLHTGRSLVTLGTDGETFNLDLAGDIELDASFPMEINLDNTGWISSIQPGQIDIPGMILNRRNVGFSTDIGIIHQLNDELTLSASILDLGFILWRDEVNNGYGSVDFSYEGVTTGLDFTSPSFYRELYDSTLNAMDYGFIQDSYLTPLPLKIYLGASYQWTENISFGGVSRITIANRIISPSLTAVTRATLLNNIQATISWSYMNRSINNFGAGLAYTGKGFQVHMITDNFLGFIKPLGTQTLNFRLGMNLMLGCPREKGQKVRGTSSYGAKSGPSINTSGHSMVPCPKKQLKKQRENYRRRRF